MKTAKKRASFTISHLPNFKSLLLPFIYSVHINYTIQSVLLLEDNDVPVHELIQGLVKRDIIVLYPLC